MFVSSFIVSYGSDKKNVSVALNVKQILYGYSVDAHNFRQSAGYCYAPTVVSDKLLLLRYRYIIHMLHWAQTYLYRQVNFEQKTTNILMTYEKLIIGRREY